MRVLKMAGKLAEKKVLRESETVELKRSTSELREAVVAIAAILNKHHEGVLYFGVDNGGRVIGQPVSEQTIREVSRAIAEGIEPKIYPKISKVVLDGKSCVHVEFRGQEVPYYAYGRPYMRVGDENRQLSAKELENLILHKNRDKLRWDNEVCLKAKISDIGSSKLRSFLRKAGLPYDSVGAGLGKLGLLRDGKLLNAAVLLFGKKPQRFFPNARLRCAVFATENTVTPLDMQDFSGDLFYLIEKAEEYILRNIHVGMRLEGLYRVDVPEIDKEAFREAVINAFCHRDYYEYDSVNIAVFKDRLEIRSPGLLYGGLTIERIRRGNVSERRNELVAEMFHRIHFIEKWGKGIRLILSREPKTVFKEVGRQFWTVFKRKNYEAEAGRGVEKGVEKGLERLSDKEVLILSLIRGNPGISKGQIQAEGRLKRKAVDYNIAKLKEKGILKRVGPDKGGHWEVRGREG